MTCKMFCVVSVSAAILLAGIAAVGQATVIDPVGATVSSEYGGGGNAYGKSSSLWATDTFGVWHATDANVMNWYQDDNSLGGKGNWLSNYTATDQSVLLDLGTPQELSKIYLWNYTNNQDYGRGINTFRVYSSNANGDLLTQLETGELTLAEATSSGTYASTQAFDLTNASSVQYVKILIDSNHGDANDLVGLAKVRFESVPEPSTLVLLAAALLGLLAYAWRKRN